MSDNKDLILAVDIAKREILQKLADEEPWLFEEPRGLYHLAKSLQNGKKTFTIHIEDGFVKEVVIHTSVKSQFKKKA